MHTMHYPDEIRGTIELVLPEERTSITEQEMAMATSLIDQLTEPYDPAQYQDEYRMALERIVEGKLGAEKLVSPAPTASKRKVTDLMEALKASIAATKKRRSEPGQEKQPEIRLKTRSRVSKSKT